MQCVSSMPLGGQCRIETHNVIISSVLLSVCNLKFLTMMRLNFAQSMHGSVAELLTFNKIDHLIFALFLF
jgi:hypothetical protein